MTPSDKTPSNPPETQRNESKIFDFNQSIPKSNEEAYLAKVSQDQTSPEDMLPVEVANTIVDAYAIRNKCTKTQAMVGIAFLIQEGGTNSSKTNLTRTVNDINFNINELRTVIRNNHPNGTVRQLAKTMRKIIGRIATINSWPGTLTREINRISETPISSADSIYCCEIYSDFYDEVMPPRIRELLQRRERELLDAQKRTRETSKRPPKGGKKKKKNK